jgi:uncharacterized protein involved in exopolysaccharide biosynthesis
LIPRPASASTPIAARTLSLEEYLKKQQELKELTSKFTSRHPEVEAAALQLERLRMDLTPEDVAALERPDPAGDEKANAQAASAMMPNAVYQNMVAQLQQVKTELEIRERERSFIELEIQKFNQRVQNTPQSEQEIAEVLRQNTDLSKQYETLKNNLGQAKLSESLESRQRGSQFVVLDPANFPLLAAKPSKARMILAGTFLSLLAAIGIAVAADMCSQRIWKQSEIESIFGVFVLAEIPSIVTSVDLAAARRRNLIDRASTVAGAAAYGVGLYFIYVKQSYVLLKLDPLIQRLIQ